MAKLSEQHPSQQENPGPQDAQGSAWNSAQGGVAGLLAKRRETLEWKLTDIAEALRIRAEYLAALERGSLDGLPGPAYAMGFLRAYADYLGFDGKEIVNRFKAEQTSLNAKPELTFPMPLTERGIPGSGLLLTALILVGLGYGTWYYLSSDKGGALPDVQPVPVALLPKPAPEAPKPSVVAPKPVLGPLAPTHVVAGTPTPVPASGPVADITHTPAIPAAASPALPAPVASEPKAAVIVPAVTAPPPPVVNVTPSVIVIAATAPTWFQLSENHQPIVTKMLQAGESYNVPNQPGISLWTGNAGGIHLIVNGHSLPTLGRIGEIKHHILLDPAALTATDRH